MTIALSSIVSLLAAWVVLYVGIRPALVEAHRQRLFALRDELFDLATSGKIAFDAPAYVNLRRVLNGQLRFAETVDFITFLSMSLLWPRNEDRLLENWEANWQQAVRQLPHDVRREVTSIRLRMHLAVGVHGMTSDPIWMPVWFVVILFMVVLAFIVAFMKSTQQITTRARLSLARKTLTVQERLDVTAVACAA